MPIVLSPRRVPFGLHWASAFTQTEVETALPGIQALLQVGPTSTFQGFLGTKSQVLLTFLTVRLTGQNHISLFPFAAREL